MSNSLKDALIKAGVVKKDDLEREKEKVRREKIQEKGPSQQGIHAHHMRTDCDHCKKSSPDVEFYEHTNRSILAKWLCIPCADKGWIKDDCRVTNQSSQSKTGRFRREFGATKKFPAGANVPNPYAVSGSGTGGLGPEAAAIKRGPQQGQGQSTQGRGQGPGSQGQNSTQGNANGNQAPGAQGNTQGQSAQGNNPGQGQATNTKPAQKPVQKAQPRSGPGMPGSRQPSGPNKNNKR